MCRNDKKRGTNQPVSVEYRPFNGLYIQFVLQEERSVCEVIHDLTVVGNKSCCRAAMQCE